VPTNEGHPLRRSGVGPIRATKTSDALAAALRERILTGEYGEGTALPPERDLVDETGLGRGSVREALRLLEAEGLIRTKTGRHGGTFTTLPDESGMTRFVSQFVRGRRVPIRALLEARATIEPNLAYFAAGARSADDLAALTNACDELETAADGAAFGRANLAWHYAVAIASHNELLVAFLASISSAIVAESDVHALAFEGTFGAVRTAVIRAHRGVTDAIAAADCDAARRRMERHLAAYAATTSNDGDASDVELT
jgi:DNA-binding FadR family transcriptional regulator